MSSENVKGSGRRPYRKRRRAELEEQTRRQITEATVRLHGTIGPARTTIKAIAEEAGVQRATVYRHFPDMESVFMACSAHWASLNPPPEPEGWSAIEDPDERLRHALTELYAWFEWGEPMLVNVRRDVTLMPAATRAREVFDRRFDSLHAALMQGRRASGRSRARVAALIGHALQFETWRSLVREGKLRPEEAVEAMVALISAAPAARTRRRPSGKAGPPTASARATPQRAPAAGSTSAASAGTSSTRRAAASSPAAARRG